jgi:hypothetical protein
MLAQRGQTHTSTQAHTVTVTRPLFIPNHIKLPCVCTCVCACAHVCVQKNVHACMHVCWGLCMQTCAFMFVWVCKRLRVHEHAWVRARAYAFACGLRFVHACAYVCVSEHVRVCIRVRVHVHEPLCVCMCICAYRCACTYVSACRGCVHARECVCRFCSCIISALETFSGVGLPCPKGNPAHTQTLVLLYLLLIPLLSNHWLLNHLREIRDTVLTKTFVKNCRYRGYKFCGLEGQWKVALDHSFRPYSYVHIRKTRLYTYIRRIYTPAKIHIRLYEYGYGDKLFIHPYIYRTYIYAYTVLANPTNLQVALGSS